MSPSTPWSTAAARSAPYPDPAYRRAYQRLNQLRQLGLFQPETVDSYPGENPIMISRAFALAEKNGLTMTALARELACPLPRLRLLLGYADGDTRTATSDSCKSLRHQHLAWVPAASPLGPCDTTSADTARLYVMARACSTRPPDDPHLRTCRSGLNCSAAQRQRLWTAVDPALPDMDFRNSANSNFSSNIVSEFGSTNFVECLVRLQTEAAGDDFFLDLGGAAEDRLNALSRAVSSPRRQGLDGYCGGSAARRSFPSPGFWGIPYR